MVRHVQCFDRTPLQEICFNGSQTEIKCSIKDTTIRPRFQWLETGLQAVHFTRLQAVHFTRLQAVHFTRLQAVHFTRLQAVHFTRLQAVHFTRLQALAKLEHFLPFYILQH